MVSAILVYQYPIVRTVLSNIVTLAPTQRSAVLGAVVRHPYGHEGKQTRIGLGAAHAKVVSEKFKALVIGPTAVAAHVGLGFEAFGGRGGGNLDGGVGQVDDSGGDVVDRVSGAGAPFTPTESSSLSIN